MWYTIAMKTNSCLTSLAKIALIIGAPSILGAGYAIHNTPMIYTGWILVGVLLVVVPTRSNKAPQSLSIAELADLARAGNLTADKTTRAFCRDILSRLEGIIPDDETDTELFDLQSDLEDIIRSKPGKKLEQN